MASGQTTLDRLASFRVFYLAIFAFVVLSVMSLRVAESLLEEHFRSEIEAATWVSPLDGSVRGQIADRVHGVIQRSAWTRIGGVRVNAFVLAADGHTPLYAGARPIRPPPGDGLVDTWDEALRLMPASADVVASVPPDSLLSVSLLVVYFAVLIQGLFLYYRRVGRREEAHIAAAVSARDLSAQRAGEIESELEKVRRRLAKVEPTERAHAEEISSLQQEREALQHKLAGLAEREAELRNRTARSLDLEQERQALEELLEEAVDDLGHKEEEIHTLQARLKRAGSPPSRGKGRAAEQLSRRLRTLYRNLEIEERVVQDLVALRDETMILKAEESLKRLSDDPETATVRRKVGGLPAHLSIYELGFAGKGRIYYRRGRQRRYQVLAVGAKNTQKTDLDYLGRLPAD